jgi:hypothetical protein
MAFSAEEIGLIGSRHFVDHPTIELERIKAMINLDMIGRYRPDKFEIEGGDSAEEFNELIEKRAGELEMKYRASRDMFGRSDHASFERKKIPVLFAFTGLHPEYHRPGDDWDLINAEGATQVLQLMYRITRDVADMEDGPKFMKPDAKKKEMSTKDDAPAAEKKDGDKAESRDAKPDEKAQDKPDRGDAGGDEARPVMPRVRLGIMPNYTDTDRHGLAIEDVVENGAAAKAGLKAGDRIVKINDSEVTNIETYMSAMGKLKGGDDVSIVVERGTETVTIKLKAPEPPKPKDGGSTLRDEVDTEKLKLAFATYSPCGRQVARAASWSFPSALPPASPSWDLQIHASGQADWTAPIIVPVRQ